MILLNWNSFSLTALASLNSSSWDVLGADQSGVLEQRGFHCLSIFWSLETSGQGPGESRVGAGNEAVMNIFHTLRDKTGPIDLGMKNAFFLFFFHLLFVVWYREKSELLKVSYSVLWPWCVRISH